MGTIAGYHHLSLTVGNTSRSARWYREVFAMEIEKEFERPGFRRARLRTPDGELTLTLTSHEDQLPGTFDERRIGLDHVAFRVGGLDELEGLKGRLERLGIDHSAIRTGGDGTAMLTLRDPDDIQLEVFSAPTPG